MSGMVAERPSALIHTPPNRTDLGGDRGQRGSWRLQPGWPLIVSFVGLPLWWVLGLIQVVFVLMAVPMVVYLARSRIVRTPRGLGVWLLFLVWLLGGIFTMQVAAPSAIPNQSLGRYVVFGYRGLWYVIGTIALLYVLNTKSFLSTQRICQALGWMFVALVGGGLLGVLAPTLEFPSALEIILPNVISSNGFVSSLIHPQVAQIQDFLGYIEPRPSAPFAFSNEWGLNLAVTLPFFVVSWWRRGGGYRWAMPVVLALASIPIISSLNRGLWLALVVIVLYLVVRSAVAGRLSVLIGIVIAVCIAGLLIATSPLGGLLQDRINTPHSNEGRTNLSRLSVQSTLEGSPVIGFGSTRDVEGNFNSIAGGASDRCPRCSPPPLGTQGQLWLVLFGTGAVGLILYCGFFAIQFLRNIRSRSPFSLASQCALIALLVTMPVYNAVGTAIFVALIAVGVMSREAAAASERSLTDLIDPALRNVALVLGFALLGTGAGAAVQQALGSNATATQGVLVSASNIFGVSGTRALSLDSEAQIVASDAVLRDVAAAVDEDSVGAISDAISISAEPNSKILKVSYTDSSAAVARTGVTEAVDSYIEHRRDLINEMSEAQIVRLEDQQAALLTTYGLVAQTTSDASGPVNPQLIERATQLRLTSRTTFGDLSNLVGGNASGGQAIGEAKVRQPIDGWLIRLGSGFMLGLLVGLVTAWYTDGRWSRVGNHPERRMGIPIPTVAEVKMSRSDPDLSDIWAVASDAALAVRAYRPLGGIVADVASPTARDLAMALRSVLTETSSKEGRRVLLVASEDSTPRNVRRMYRECRIAGQQPVGLIFATGRSSRSGVNGESSPVH